MKTFYSDQFVLPLPEGHRFPMEKYRMLRERVAGELPGCELVVPDAATDEDLRRAHTGAYVGAACTGLDPRAERRIGFPWSPGLVERSRRSVGGTIGAGAVALVDGSAVNLAGGTHHALPDAGEGFCVFNDVGVAIRRLQAEGRIGRAAVLDLDVHQGNGTARLFAGDDAVFTTSVHGRNNYPFRKEPSDLDVPLGDGARDGAYLAAVDEAIAAVVAHRPGLVFYVAGADPYVGDRLGRLAVSRLGLGEREQRVFSRLADAGIPVAAVMGGGYAESVDDTVAIHFETVRVALESHAAHASARRTSR